MKKVEILQELTKMWQWHQIGKCCWRHGTDKLVWCKVTANLQLKQSVIKQGCLYIKLIFSSNFLVITLLHVTDYWVVPYWLFWMYFDTPIHLLPKLVRCYSMMISIVLFICLIWKLSVYLLLIFCVKLYTWVGHFITWTVNKTHSICMFKITEHNIWHWNLVYEFQ